MQLVKYIDYNESKWPIRISYYSIKKFQEETGKEISELDKDISMLEVLLWYGLIAGHAAVKQPMTLKREEMEFVLDESMGQFNQILMEFFPVATGSEEVDSKKK